MPESESSPSKSTPAPTGAAPPRKAGDPATPKTTAKGASKGTKGGAKRGPSGRTTPKGTSSRYTPPTPKTVVKSPLWVPVLMFALLGMGVLVVVTNYLGLLPGEQQNWYLILGLAQITAGFVVATFYK